ncbi:response regulator [Roseospira visakhapatnamensis]|uniref:CheY-like chemotaxis protein n=1 Tax=Roseospira visakhapatnamensis TaxID=390880 RepID=A0A7W6RBK7_9PROT|nr:response regulator [Roseospira visakhapatnamensis]MBB4265479.1 CheY-like chemotaxis protein [Roseospira visakhapatnamensis]
MVSVSHNGFRANILVIDEDPRTAQVMRRILDESRDGRVLAVPDVLGGLRLACQEPPAVILLDGMMQDMDRVTGLLLLKAHPSTRIAPVVVMTPRLRPPDMEAAYRVGAHAHVLKPLQNERLTNALQAALVAGRPAAALS